MTRSRYALAISTLLLMIALFGCGGGTKTITAISVRTTPANAGVPQGANQIFAATVTGTSNTAVTWSLQEGVAAGTITQTGVYSAPATAGTFHLVATSKADTTKTAVATITVPAVAVSISPTPVTVARVASKTFTATVTGASNTVVTWSLQEGTAAGAITQAGVYAAPSTAGTYHVIATSKADATKSATATVTVN